MPVLTNQLIVQGGDRTYHIHVPADPAQATVPAIVVFHGGGQDAETIARRWGLEPGNPVPANVADYLLVFPEADARLPVSGSTSRTPTAPSPPSTSSSSTCSSRS